MSRHYVDNPGTEEKEVVESIKVEFLKTMERCVRQGRNISYVKKELESFKSLFVDEK